LPAFPSRSSHILPTALPEASQSAYGLSFLFHRFLLPSVLLNLRQSLLPDLVFPARFEPLQNCLLLLFLPDSSFHPGEPYQESHLHRSGSHKEKLIANLSDHLPHSPYIRQYINVHNVLFLPLANEYFHLYEKYDLLLFLYRRLPMNYLRLSVKSGFYNR